MLGLGVLEDRVDQLEAGVPLLAVEEFDLHARSQSAGPWGQGHLRAGLGAISLVCRRRLDHAVAISVANRAPAGKGRTALGLEFDVAGIGYACPSRRVVDPGHRVTESGVDQVVADRGSISQIVVAWYSRHLDELAQTMLAQGLGEAVGEPVVPSPAFFAAGDESGGAQHP